MDLYGLERLAGLDRLPGRFARLGEFFAILEIYRQEVAAGLGLSATIDAASLNRAFFDWMEAVDRDARPCAADRQDFLVFSAGVLLCELLHHDPCRVEVMSGESRAKAKGCDEIAAFWPSGWFYTGFCLTSLAAVSRRHRGRALLPGSRADDLRTWWSFRENARKDCTSAIGFLDIFLGREPNWNMPGRIDKRAAMRHGGAAAGL
jgi:hypothetical protein